MNTAPAEVPGEMKKRTETMNEDTVTNSAGTTIHTLGRR